MVTVSAFMLIACAAFFLWRGYQIRCHDRYDLIAGLKSRELRNPVAWCRLVGLLQLVLGSGFLLVALLALAFPTLSREIATVFCATVLLAWGPLLSALQRYEGS